MEDPRQDDKKPIEGHNKDGECTINDTIPGIIKYGVNPSELGDRTIKTGKELEENVATRKMIKKSSLHKSNNKEAK
ncbi:MAG: hypothetical protein HQ534_08015 [Armatimonadetes bacterium]|nr:hypothetical protein [Armatimonadota bacterium]